jgi:hypothetical protein
MNTILQYVLEKGSFTPFQTAGYETVPFTHQEFCDYAQQLMQNNELKNESKGDVVILVLPFEEDGKSFVFRHLEKIGKCADQVWTRKAYEERLK